MGASEHRNLIEVTIRESQGLPPLGWLVRVDPSCQHVTIEHGARVERGTGWIIEGVWDGPFGSRFDTSPHLFGSGVRVTDDSIVFVPSCALVDRLLWAERDGELVVSNSLAILLAATGWRLISGHRYERTLHAVTKGIDAYDDQIATDSGTVHHLYYRNLEVSAQGHVLRHKDAPREIGSYEE